jgi:AcrR family transcriptional regulator
MQKTNRQLKKEQTREILLKAAFEEFGKRGIMSTRMSDIAQAAGVSHGTVFAHFKTHEALCIAVIEEYGNRIALRTHELADQCAGVYGILAAHLSGIMEYEPFYIRVVIESRLLPKSARDSWVAAQSAISFHLSKAIEQEIKQGLIKDTPVHLLFNTWIGLIHYYLANSDLFAPDGNVIEKYGETLIDYYLKLLRSGV